MQKENCLKKDFLKECQESAQLLRLIFLAWSFQLINRLINLFAMDVNMPTF